TIGKVAFVDRLPLPSTLNSGVFVLRPKENKFHPQYLYYILNSTYFDSFLTQLAASSTISHLYQKDFVNFSFPVPDYEEQKAIAQILSDMDAEIEALEAKRDKYKAIKQGMMQELLTGKIRLV
ncbi:MAG: restriction endonuclease subunit S, partial [Aridibacter sp.]